MSSRYGGFTTRKIFSVWNDRVSKSAKNIDAPASINDIDYSTIQGIWNLRSTTQFPKQTFNSVSFVTSAVTANVGSIVIPSSAKAGDLAILFDYSATYTTYTVPANWDLIVRTVSVLHAMCSYKILTAQDVGASVTGLPGSALKTILVFRPNRPISAITVGSVNGQTTTSAPSNQTLSVPFASSPILGIAQYISTGAITSAASTVNMSTVTNTTNQLCKYSIFGKDSPSSNSTISMGDHGTNLMQSFYLKLD